MTSANSLSLILRRLDEIERKLDRMMEELRTPHCHRLFGTQGQSSEGGLNPPATPDTLLTDPRISCNQALGGD